jgi:hypothetical protein
MKNVAAPAKAPKHWHAVGVVAKSSACEAARALRTKRFLSAEAPRLPLPQCTKSKECQCAYKHYADRRAGPRRQDEDAGIGRNTKVTEERRSQRDRRATES